MFDGSGFPSWDGQVRDTDLRDLRQLGQVFESRTIGAIGTASPMFIELRASY